MSGGNLAGRSRCEHDGAHQPTVIRGKDARDLVAEGVAEHHGPAEPPMPRGWGRSTIHPAPATRSTNAS